MILLTKGNEILARCKNRKTVTKYLVHKFGPDAWINWGSVIDEHGAKIIVVTENMGTGIIHHIKMYSCHRWPKRSKAGS